MTDKAKPRGPEQDAAGQSERNHKGGHNDGVTSATPRVTTRTEDATAGTYSMKPRTRD